MMAQTTKRSPSPNGHNGASIAVPLAGSDRRDQVLNAAGAAGPASDPAYRSGREVRP
jgi:hypothetical protein